MAFQYGRTIKGTMRLVVTEDGSEVLSRSSQ